jgi:hypothetical protein
MTGLVFATGAFAIVSGLIKLFGRSRTPGAVQVLPLLEVFSGVGAPLLGMAWETESAGVIALVALPLSMVVVSTTHQAITTKARRMKREESEGARLATFVNFLADQDQDEAPPSSSPVMD